MQYDDVKTNSRWRTDAILKVVFGYSLAPYWSINAKFESETKNHIQIHYRSSDQNGNFCKFTMAVECHIDCFSLIFRCHFGQFMGNMDSRCRMTWSHRSCDQDNNIQKFNMVSRCEFSQNAFTRDFWKKWWNITFMWLIFSRNNVENRLLDGFWH